MNDRPSLISLIDERLESGKAELPVFDNVALRISREAREGRLDADGLCLILQEDPALVGEVMRMANSSFFRGLSEVRTLREAAVRLGVKQIAAITMSASQKRMYSASKGPFKARLVQLWLHASAVSTAARWLAVHIGSRNLADEAHVAGLLHDVGKMSLLRIIEDIVAADPSVRLTNELVAAALDRLYCEHGARLLELWNLPESFRRVVRHQADETLDDSDVTLCIVRLADKACALEGISDRPDPAVVLETLPETRALGLCEIDLAELRLTIEDCEGARKKAA